MYLVVVALVAMTAPMGMQAQPVRSATAPGPSPAPAPDGMVLMDQTATQTLNGFSSQNFVDMANDAFDNTSADDFVVPPGRQWNVSELFIPGFFGGGAPGPVASVDVTFYDDAAGLPGSQICFYDDLVAPNLAQTAGTLTITLPSACAVPEGPHWFSVQGTAQFVTAGQWFWFTSSAVTFNPFAWQNPGDGFGSGCTTFMVATGCGAANPDLAFILTGEDVEGTTVTDVPTLDALGLVLLTLLVATGALLMLRRRTARAS